MNENVQPFTRQYQIALTVLLAALKWGEQGGKVWLNTA